MTEPLWEQTFEYAHPVAEVWRAYLRMEGPGDGFASVPDVGATFTLTDAAASRVEITDVVVEERLAWTQDTPGRHLATTVTFEATSVGARVTITHAGFGDDEDFDVLTSSQALGYADSMQDLGVYLDTGVLERRHLGDRSATGVVFVDGPSGLVVRRCSPGSLGEQAGMQAGDLVLAIDGAAIYGRSDMWFIARSLQPGTEVEVTFVRDGLLLSGRGAMLPTTSAVTGELGLGPRIDASIAREVNGSLHHPL